MVVFSAKPSHARALARSLAFSQFSQMAQQIKQDVGQALNVNQVPSLLMYVSVSEIAHGSHAHARAGTMFPCIDKSRMRIGRFRDPRFGRL